MTTIEAFILTVAVTNMILYILTPAEYKWLRGRERASKQHRRADAQDVL